ncbi:ArnT family glycosyltransferase [Nocardia sp. NPDC060220]|uniref:ArnT family glycosyltransferase n=1 Tax=Nocardia sp. NPDC060220 TaxID=3347076 RepID=UPI003657EAA1
MVAVVFGIVATLSATRYGYYYDELYFIAAGKHPSFGYADQGPLVPLLARSMDWLFPGSFIALRIPAVAASLAVVVLSAVIARELGGARGAQSLTAIACATSAFVLGQAQTLSTNAIDTLLWAVLTWLLVRWVRTRDDALLWAAGLATAVAVQVKWLIPIFWIAVVVAVAWLGPRALFAATGAVVERQHCGAGGSAGGELGWPELVAATANAYRALPPHRQRTAVVVTQWYVQASALDHARSTAGLPPVFSPNRGFGYFGVPPDTADTVVYVGGTEADLRRWFSSVVPAGRTDYPLGIPGITTDATIWECVGPIQPWSSMWSTMRGL